MCIAAALLALEAWNVYDTANDVADTAKVFGDNCSTNNDKFKALGLLALGVIDPTPGNLGKKAARFRNLAPTDTIGNALTFPVRQIAKTSYSGKLNYIVSDTGNLVIGRSGHTSLSGGADVLAAGEAKFVNGELRSLNNASGHYQPSGASAQNAAESAFQQAGFDSIGKYLEGGF
jgi:hypothetical protein